jgi:hypothetical protein
LTVTALACRDRLGMPYEITLDLRRGSKPFASIGERCGFRLSQLAASVTAAREDPEQAAAWPDPDDRFPEPGPPGSPGRFSRHEFQPGEREYFSLKSRERSDLPGTGEFRCVLRDSAVWLGERWPSGGRGHPGAVKPGAGQPGGWSLTRRAVVEAWGADGIGLRAVLTSAELVTFLDTVLREPGGAAVAASSSAGVQAMTAGMTRASIGRLAWPQRGRVRDESTRSRLLALRAQNRSVAFAAGDPPARGGDVRR